METPLDLAYEHCRWAMRAGLTPYEVIAPMGGPPLVPGWSPGWPDAVAAVTVAITIARQWRAP